MAEEPILWKGRSSQLLNLATFAGAALLAAGAIIGAFFAPPILAALAIPIAWAGWAWLSVRARVFELTSQRLRLYEGVLSRRIDEIELYRIKDTVIEEPFWQRIFGLGNLIIETSDRSHPRVDIRAISDASQVREHVRTYVERLRDQKRVREVDFDSSEEGEFDGDFDAG